MSEYKFVVYEKLDEDAHTDRMLSESHGDIPEEITDKQLDPHHVGDKDSVMEKLLENNRTGSAEVVIEKNLDEAKDEFGSKHRNAQAYEGDMNKLEEKRLADYNIEGEEYETASETPKRQRWWEIKSEDGLKIAFEKKAQSMDIDWDYVERDRSLEDNMDDILDDPYGQDFEINEIDPDFPIEDLGDDDDVLEAVKEVYYEEIDIGGTPTAVGKLEITGTNDTSSLTLEDIADDLEYFMSKHHGEIPFSLASFDDSKLSQGIVTYQIGLDEVGEDFEVTDLDEEDLMDEEDRLFASNYFKNRQIVEATKKK